jgi:hypothetical protein
LQIWFGWAANAEALEAVQQHRARFPDVFPLEVAALEAKLVSRGEKGQP